MNFRGLSANLSILLFIFNANGALSDPQTVFEGEFRACLSELPDLGTRMGDYQCASALHSSCQGLSGGDLAEECHRAAAQSLLVMTDRLLGEIQDLSCEGVKLAPAARNMLASIPQTREWGCEGTYLDEWECVLQVEMGNWENARFVRRSAMPAKGEACS